MTVGEARHDSMSELPERDVEQDSVESEIDSYRQPILLALQKGAENPLSEDELHAKAKRVELWVMKTLADSYMLELLKLGLLKIIVNNQDMRFVCPQFEDLDEDESP